MSKRHPSGSDTTPITFDHGEVTRERLARLGDTTRPGPIVYSWPDEPVMPDDPTTPGSKVPR